MAQRSPQRREAPTGATPRTPVGPASRPGLGRNSRLSSGLVALGLTATLSAFAVGYSRTQSADNAAAGQLASTPPGAGLVLAQPTTTATATASIIVAGPVPTATAGATRRRSDDDEHQRSALAGATATTQPAPPAPSGLPQPTPTPTRPAAAANALRDGTYSGLGSSRHGSIGATVTIRGGRIAAVVITDCGTRYPCRVIGALPGEVVARQSAAVDVISGATDSSSAFRGAIESALAQAR